MKKHALPLAFSVVLLAACTTQASITRVPLTLQSPASKELIMQVEVADTFEERKTGLMGRTELEEGTGMLFIFDQPQKLTFWMKDTLIPLDILFFDADKKFVSRTTMQPCVAEPCPTYASNSAAQYALEVMQGEPLTKDVGRRWVLEF